MATMARCRSCKAEFSLVRLLDDWRCCCPCCDRPLARDGAQRATILRKAAAADRLETQLVEALSEIATMESDLEVAVAPTIARFLTRINGGTTTTRRRLLRAARNRTPRRGHTNVDGTSEPALRRIAAPRRGV